MVQMFLTYRFLRNNKISAEDIQQLIDLTEGNSLHWQYSQGLYALYANPIEDGAIDDPAILAEAIGTNLRGIRLGYVPSHLRGGEQVWKYLRLTAHDGSYHYVEMGSPEKLMLLCNRLFLLAMKSARQ